MNTSGVLSDGLKYKPHKCSSPAAAQCPKRRLVLFLLVVFCYMLIYQQKKAHCMKREKARKT